MVKYNLSIRNKKHNREVFYFNNGFEIEIGDLDQNKNMLISGTSGGGKTVLLAGMGDQIGQGLLIDTKGKGREAIEKVGFQGWDFYDIKNKRLLINADELHFSSVNVLFREDTLKEQKLAMVFRKFCSLPKHKKKFRVLRKYLDSIREYNFANDLEMVFSRSDRGKSISELFGKKIGWNIRGASQFNKAIGLFIKMIFDYTYRHPLTSSYFLAVDDAQTAATAKTTLGKAFAQSFSEGRAFGIVTMLSGTHDSYVNYGCKINSDLIFYFPSRKQEKKLKVKGIDFKDARMANLRRGHSNGCCFVETSLPALIDGRRTSLEEPFPIYFDVFEYLYKKRTKLNKADGIPVKMDFHG